MILDSWLQACAYLVLMTTASTSLGGEEYGPVRSSDLGLEFRAPAGWLVRHLSENGESVVAITSRRLSSLPGGILRNKRERRATTEKERGPDHGSCALRTCSEARTRDNKMP